MNAQTGQEIHGKDEHQRRFGIHLDEYISQRKDTKIKTEGNYKKILEAVQGHQDGEKFVDDQVRRNYATRFRSSVINGKLELLHNGKIVLTPERAFEILYVAHSTGGCCGRDIMWQKVKQYYGITQRLVTLFVYSCSICPLKKGKPKKGVVVKPLISSRRNQRCQLDLIDMQSKADGDWKFIAVYQDHLTKFVILRALKTKSAAEVAAQVSSIFALFGSPEILQTDNGREFANATLEKLVMQWPGCKLIHGKPRHSQSQGSVERCNRDVEEIMFAEMLRRGTPNWAELLDTVQFIKNTRYHRGIARTPFKAMFGFDYDAKNDGVSCDGDQEVPTGDELTVLEEGAEELDDVDLREFEDEEEYFEEQEPEGYWTAHHSAIEKEREETSQSLQRQADRMLQASDSRFGPIDVGTSVLVAIPDVDRPKIGARNLMAVVLEEKDGFYRLATSKGHLPQWYARNQLDPLQESFIKPSDVPDINLSSFRSAVAQDSITGGQGHQHCNCNGKCDTNRCSCKSRNYQCKSRCHKSNSACKNK